MRSEFKKTWETSDHNLPSLWPYLLPEEYEYFEFPQEKTSDCSKCPQTSCHGYQLPQRCCTYIPRLPNYSIGMILKDESRRHLALDLLDKNMLIPEGLVLAPKLWKKSIELYDTNQFGKTNEIVCPFLNRENSYCNIHPYRNGVCSSFFCYPDYGEMSEDFWGDIGSFIGQSEAALSQWCMENNGYTNAQYFSLMRELSKDLEALSNDDGSWSDKSQIILWRHMSKADKINYFENCADMVLNNLASLRDIVSNIELDPVQPLELAQLGLLDSDVKERLGDEIRVEGKAVNIKDLEYSLKASSRNMNYIPFSGAEVSLSSDIKIIKNPMQSNAEKFYHNKDYKLIVATGPIWFINRQEKLALESLQNQKKVDSDLLDHFENLGYDGRSFLRQWTGRNVLKYL